MRMAIPISLMRPSFGSDTAISCMTCIDHVRSDLRSFHEVSRWRHRNEGRMDLAINLGSTSTVGCVFPPRDPCSIGPWIGCENLLHVLFTQKDLV